MKQSHTADSSIEATSPGVVHHRVTAHDAELLPQMRKQSAPLRGALRSPSDRPVYDEIIARTREPEGVTFDTSAIGGIPGVWCRPNVVRTDVVILYLHGGGYVLGSSHAYRRFAGHIAAKTKADAFVAEYRLAPEHPFPAAIDDALAAYRGLIGRRAPHIVIAGDSAGGGLALALFSIARAERIAPAACIALSPLTDLTLSGESMRDHAELDATITPEMVASNAALYLQGKDANDPLASPLFAGKRGLAPVQIHVGENEVLLSDSLRYVTEARAAGVDACAHVWEGMPHVFPSRAGVLDAADDALDLIAAFVDEKVCVPTRPAAASTRGETLQWGNERRARLAR